MTTSGGSAGHPITTAYPRQAGIISYFRSERRIEIDQVNALGREGERKSDDISEFSPLLAVSPKGRHLPGHPKSLV
jgi:hypothetical protein